MGLFGSPPPKPLPPSVPLSIFNVSDGASFSIAIGAALCVYNAWRSDHLPSGSILAWQLSGLAVSLISVSVPGRFDSDVDPVSMAFPWPTLFAPAGFAFAIWGIIFVGEIAGAVVLATRTDISDASAPAARAWFYANVAQALWCLAFRPWALDRLWLSSACLAATAGSLVASQHFLVVNGASNLVAASASGRAPWALWALVAWPRSLHAGWVTAAALVNINAWAGKAAIGPARAFAVAVLSLIGAAGLGNTFAAAGLHCAAAAIAWALFAVSRGKPVGADAVALGQAGLDGLAIASSAVAGVVTLAMVRRAVA